MIVVDYGYPAAELYGPARRAGTLLGYRGHRVVDDPYVSVGRQDLTAHVDFTALELAAGRRGFDVLGKTSQAAFLVALGVEDLLRRVQANPATTMGDYVALRSGLVRLLDPRALGGFRVLLLGKGLPEGAAVRGLGDPGGRGPQR